MSDYIKREDALDIILKYFPRSAKKLNIYREINNLPAADVAEVRHGHWEFPVSHRTAGEGEGAFSRGVNTGLDIARSAMRNPDAIPTLPHPSGWVSVNERLPSEEIDVLLLVRETEYYGKHGEKRHVYRWVFSGWNIDGEWATTYCHGHKMLSNQAEEDPKIEYKVTHWMPLPDPPISESEGTGEEEKTNEEDESCAY